MTRKFSLLTGIIFLYTCFSTVQSQSVGIGTVIPDNNAILDIKSTTKGLLIPRMTTAQRTAIATPAKGLIVFDITTSSFWFHNGTAWEVLSSGSSTNYWSLSGSDIYNNNVGNVGIGTVAPLAYGHGGNNRITEISNPNTGSNIQSHLILSTNGTSGSVGGITWASQNVPGNEKRLGFIGDVYETSNAARMVFYTRAETGDLGERLTVLGNGNVGIGIATPTDKFTVQTLSNNFGISHTDGIITVGTYVGLGDGWLGTKSNHPLALFTNNSLPQMTIATNGNVGIGLSLSTPLAKLHIAGNVKIDANNTLEFGAGVAGKEASAGKIGYQAFTPGALDIVGAGTLGSNRRIKFWNEGGASFAGNVGIGEPSPANRLQIGSMGPTGFNGNDIAIGNGTNATGIFQSADNLQVYSSTNIALMPQSGTGRVGINTTSPRAPLEVDGNVDVANNYSVIGMYAYYTLGYNSMSGATDLEGGNNLTTIPNISIYASNRIFASEFDAFSDARIKNIGGLSNATKDLQIINALQITDYTMRDKVKYGNKPFKKVIAQEVEKVFPQVISKHTDFIPNVYQLSNKIEKTTAGYLLSFTNKHNISNTAKKLRVLLSGTEVMQEMNILSIPSDTQVIINAPDIKSDKVFVYGEEVDDFRTVDYEGLTTLNISATQELSKLITVQNKKIEALEEEIKMMKEARSITLQTKQ